MHWNLEHRQLAQLGTPFSADPLPSRERRPPLPECSISGASKPVQDVLNML